jgi:hypothetical protein
MALNEVSFARVAFMSAPRGNSDSAARIAVFPGAPQF